MQLLWKEGVRVTGLTSFILFPASVIPDRCVVDRKPDSRHGQGSWEKLLCGVVSKGCLPAFLIALQVALAREPQVSKGGEKVDIFSDL